MSDLDAALRELREDLHATITKPGLDRVADRARYRSVRRRMQIGAIVAVVLVSVAVPLLRSMPDPTPPATPPTPTRTVPYELSVGDDSHLYALGRDCPGALDPCRYRLMASSDGGRTWAERTVPVPRGTYVQGQLYAAGATRLIFYSASADGRNFVTYVSHDTGRTWRDEDLTSTPVRDPAPLTGGARLDLACPSPTADGCATVKVGHKNDQGTFFPTPAQPPLTPTGPAEYPTASGVYWLIGKDQAGRWGVSVTRDGRSWATTALDVPGDPQLPDAWSAVEGGGSLYLTAVGALRGAGQNRLLVVYRSTDHGRTWTRTYQGSGKDALFAFGTPVATSQGRLLVNSLPEGTVESRDGGRTFTRATQQLPASPKWTPGGYLVQVDPRTYEISKNGVDWRRFEVP